MNLTQGNLRLCLFHWGAVTVVFAVIASSIQGIYQIWTRDVDLLRKGGWGVEDVVRRRFLGPSYAFLQKAAQQVPHQGRAVVVSKEPPWFAAYYLTPIQLYWYYGDSMMVDSDEFNDWLDQKGISWVLVWPDTSSDDFSKAKIIQRNKP